MVRNEASRKCCVACCWVLLNNKSTRLLGVRDAMRHQQQDSSSLIGKLAVTTSEILSQSYELELGLIQTQVTQKPMLRGRVGMCVRCANKASAECVSFDMQRNQRDNCFVAHLNGHITSIFRFIFVE